MKATKAWLWQSTWILSVSALITKILSALYRVPLQNIVGDRGFFVYQQVYPLYGICNAIALTGVPLFISQIIAENTERQRSNFKQLAILVVILGVISSVSLYEMAPTIARLMGDDKLIPLIRSLTMFYLLAPIEALLRGSFQGTLKMLPTALSQVVEQIVRVVIIVVAAFSFKYGILSIYNMGAWAHAGSVFGCFAALAVLGLFLPHLCLQQVSRIRTSLGVLLRRFLNEGLLLSLFGSLLILFQMIDSFTLLKSLRKVTAHAELIKGVYDRGQPLAQLGIVVAVSFATTLLPQISDHKNKSQLVIINKTLHIAASLATACAVGLAVLMPQINTLLFKDKAQSLALAVYVLAVAFISYATIMNTIMQAQHLQKRNWLVLIIALFVKWLGNLMFIPVLSISGASWATLLASTVLAVGIYWNSGPVLQKALTEHNFLLKLLVICGLMGLVVGMFSLISLLVFPLTRFISGVEVLVGVVLGVLVVLFYSYHWHLYTTSEWRLMPGYQLIHKKLGGK
ncbi:polysaccharide biosynthesis protein [Bombilactobacillus thymidiniphilus]|uniref:Polysaccharide biosynthesis protein n=1 Tax=Bombilactobacillus thymidiniphilus TaxID=2923363 RepID=A0ABY4PEG6_9LACO|nr:polysaccharide biosynthesis protein [Bombilactobacillus thymidiniphilus]UQS84025.1 polysaccharide biosynthesis protein [Bombilactobacillus thymidiniphilus]